MGSIFRFGGVLTATPDTDWTLPSDCETIGYGNGLIGIEAGLDISDYDVDMESP